MSPVSCRQKAARRKSAKGESEFDFYGLRDGNQVLLCVGLTDGSPGYARAMTVCCDTWRSISEGDEQIGKDMWALVGELKGRLPDEPSEARLQQIIETWPPHQLRLLRRAAIQMCCEEKDFQKSPRVGWVHGPFQAVSIAVLEGKVKYPFQIVFVHPELPL